VADDVAHAGEVHELIHDLDGLFGSDDDVDIRYRLPKASQAPAILGVLDLGKRRELRDERARDR